MRLAWSWLAVVCLTGCDFQIGPAYPERDGRAALMQQGYPAAGIEAVVKGERLEPGEVEALRRHRSRDVRFLVARNRHLTSAELGLYLRDPDDFVRSGAAANPGLTAPQVATLANDASHTVRMQLAGNAALSEAQLLSLHAGNSPGLLGFAFNPNCPDSLREEIRRSDDDLAKRWVQIIEDWKRNGTFVRGPDGRWRRP